MCVCVGWGGGYHLRNLLDNDSVCPIPIPIANDVVKSIVIKPLVVAVRRPLLGPIRKREKRKAKIEVVIPRVPGVAFVCGRTRASDVQSKHRVQKDV
jgi:hypothetical protein